MAKKTASPLQSILSSALAAASSSPMTPLPSKPATQLRDDLTEIIRKDLLGPAGGEAEELPWNEDRVSSRYLVGMLAPSGEEINPSAIEGLAAAGIDSIDEGSTDQGAPGTLSFAPSSMGFSFTLDPECQSFFIKATWGEYRREPSSTGQVKKNGDPQTVWKRYPHAGGTPAITLDGGNFGPISPDPSQPEVIIRGRIRRRAYGWVVTAFLVNTQQPKERSKDSKWIFQCWIAAGSRDMPEPFVQRHPARSGKSNMDALNRREMDSLEMLYRHKVEFAVGHGVSVHITQGSNPDRATMVESTFLPQGEVPMTTPPTEIDFPALAGLSLDMTQLSEMDDASLIQNLQILSNSYKQWIDGEAAKNTGHPAAAQRHVGNCHRALARMSEGISVLKSNAVAMEAFRFANRAMALQRVRSQFARAVRKGEAKATDDVTPYDVLSNRSWRAFQLGFLLLNIPSATDPLHPQRSDADEATADLLWFPTGGGKTEAYLGLAAYVLGLRRLQSQLGNYEAEYGVGVLMRYTLRLLTLQQFQRAAALICACEVIRKEDQQKWGHAPFRIGLWVGSKSTPNTTRNSEEALKDLGVSGPTAAGTPAQLTACPWCGSSIDPLKHMRAYAGPSKPWRTFTYCGDDTGTCAFTHAKSPAEGIPALTVDEELYRNPPSLLIGTVDKFAQMPWNGAVQMLFGRVNGFCERHGFRSPTIEDSDAHPKTRDMSAAKTVKHPNLRPPDLIIQDELHLISGPLGSMVGLYETAIDKLCCWQLNGKTVRPKVIASTATIRRAEEQVGRLYARKLEVFPPQGTDVRDNFFSLERPLGDAFPGRRYMGICAFGNRFPAALIRVYVAAMGGAQFLYDQFDTSVDPWMTLAGYFNSIRELGGTRRLVDDDIRSRLRDADQRGMAKRRIRKIEELTSRRSGVDIPEVLDHLEQSFGKALDAQREQLRKESKGNAKEARAPIDVVLATNMISVGVDVDRLGLMVVAGQPKTTAEYIQATSRVGRKFPGLILSVFNWARPRDLSHFESFEYYHGTFYKHVEALSITPFSARSLDRGLTGVLAGLIRLDGERLNDNDGAGKLQNTDATMNMSISTILDRVAKVDGQASMVNRTRSEIDRRRDEWLNRIHRATTYEIGYKDDSTGRVGILKQADGSHWTDFTCLNSLRDVESTVSLLLADQLVTEAPPSAAAVDSLADDQDDA